MDGFVFVSYSRLDADYVGRLVSHLTAAGLRVWTDEGIEPGVRWARRIDEQLRACVVFLPVMSEHSRASEWVANEILLAQRLRKPITPLLLSGDPFIEVLSTQYEDVTGGRLPGEGFLRRLAEFAASIAAPIRPEAGRVVGWGNNSDGQASVPDELGDVVAVAAGGRHSLALRDDGTVIAWGHNGDGQVAVPALEAVVAISAGSQHSLALCADGTVVGWGPRWFVDGRVFGRATPPAGLAGVVAIAAGGMHSLALHDDGTVTGWGSDDYGQATPPAGLAGIVAIAAGARHSLALDGAGVVTGWGGADRHHKRAWYTGYGQGIVPQLPADVIAIAAGSVHSIALHRDGTVTAWGAGRGGQASPPAGLNKVTAVAAGPTHNLALRQDGTVAGWGNDSYGQLQIPAGLTDVIAIAAGGGHSLAIVRS